MAEKIGLQTLIDRSIRNMGAGIHSVVKESAIEMIKQAYKEGIYVQITSGYRSFAEQNKLYAQGRTAPGKIVTNAKGGQSNHNYGLAIDYVLLSADGKKALWTVNEKWRRVAQIGKSLGFSWGGDWKSFKDYPHLEMMGGMTLSQLQAGKRPVLVSLLSNKVSAKPINTTPVKSSPSKSTNKPKTSTSKKTYNLPSGILKVTKPLTKGAGVKALQDALAALFFYPDKGAKNNGIDGYYGPKTADAVKRFQLMHGLASDGIYGPKTKKAIEKALK
ncbi:M15 family metallopeptidase [Bacillus pumilus]|uniref:M15 family metallopeptidase n=1 Tax=Bacillus pumilus TaxID=1408 RepID=UPI0023DA242A|nr:M15 family metallopeptidase [Bacillus pumilus]MDF2002688.1 M15 family metallopeptidase [Bacillus pumilus]MDF2025678.1 M15 family metallopeptidase [Bacillus pumilus]MDF2027570.1 M15 family metallopeptidase [Bacillus pumilus]MDF2090564.1 M15 family metallopeptidase [Bacillus pumilus]